MDENNKIKETRKVVTVTKETTKREQIKNLVL